MSNISYRAAALIIRDNNLLMAKNINHSCYYIVGGGIEFNESSEEAVIRELIEETGERFEIEKLVFVQERFCKVSLQNHHEIVFFYLMKDNPNIKINDNAYTDQGTMETLHWLPIKKLSEYDIAPEFLKTKSLENFEKIEHIISHE